MSRTTAETLEERQGLIDDIKKKVEEMMHSLDCAEGCETAQDFDANIEEVRDALQDIAKDLVEVMS